MKFYVAGSLSNIEAVREIQEMIRERGSEITYDWTTHGSVQSTPERFAEVADNELVGVLAAEVFVAVIPGGRGTHVELGAALASGAQIWMIGGADSLREGFAYDCVFHHHWRVNHVITPGEFEKALRFMLSGESRR